MSCPGPCVNVLRPELSRAAEARCCLWLPAEDERAPSRCSSSRLVLLSPREGSRLLCSWPAATDGGLPCLLPGGVAGRLRGISLGEGLCPLLGVRIPGAAEGAVAGDAARG
eukprot:12946034-Heterocapsa_arctica.AAC.1